MWSPPSVAAVETNTATSSSAPSPASSLMSTVSFRGVRGRERICPRGRWRPAGTRSGVSRRRASRGGCRCRRTARLRAATRTLAASASSPRRRGRSQWRSTHRARTKKASKAGAAQAALDYLAEHRPELLEPPPTPVRGGGRGRSL